MGYFMIRTNDQVKKIAEFRNKSPGIRKIMKKKIQGLVTNTNVKKKLKLINY